MEKVNIKVKSEQEALNHLFETGFGFFKQTDVIDRNIYFFIQCDICRGEGKIKWIEDLLKNK